MLLPLNELQSGIRGMAGTNVLQTQLQTGEIGNPSVAAIAKDSGALTITLKCGESKLGDDNVNDLQEKKL